MIAQLSHSEPCGRPSSSSSGVRSAGSLARKSGVLFFPHTSRSSKSSPAARTKIRAVRLLTLGFRMLSVLDAISLPPCRGGASVPPTAAGCNRPGALSDRGPGPGANDAGKPGGHGGGHRARVGAEAVVARYLDDFAVRTRRGHAEAIAGALHHEHRDRHLVQLVHAAGAGGLAG